MWVDFQYYNEAYLLGRSPTIPESEFLYWEKQAQSKINRNNAEIEDAPGPLKECVCEVAEYIYSRAQANSPETVKSFSNDGYSESYADQSKTTVEEQADIWEIIARHLSGTELHNDFVFSGI